MNQKNKPLYVFFAIVIGSVLVIGSMWTFFFLRETRKTRLPVFGNVPDFELVERTGRTVRLADLLGKVWVVDFIFTSCSSVCPLMNSHMKQMQEMLSVRSNVKLVSITVDPKRDTPEVLSKYADRYGAQADRWLFLTGDYNRIQSLAKSGFFLSMDPGADPKEPIIHSQNLVLVDKRGRIRGYFDGKNAAATMTVLNAINSLDMER